MFELAPVHSSLMPPFSVAKDPELEFSLPSLPEAKATSASHKVTDLEQPVVAAAASERALTPEQEQKRALILHKFSEYKVQSQQVIQYYRDLLSTETDPENQAIIQEWLGHYENYALELDAWQKTMEGLPNNQNDIDETYGRPGENVPVDFFLSDMQSVLSLPDNIFLQADSADYYEF